MNSLRNATDLSHERGKYTVDVTSFEDLTIFEGFQSEHPNNPMQFDVPNRHNLRGNCLDPSKSISYNIVYSHVHFVIQSTSL